MLGVTEPFSCGIGGGGFMVIRTPHGRVTTIHSRETAPRAMEPDSFLQADGTALPFNDARYSGLSAGVPGTVAAWDAALRRYGSWNFRHVLAPAIDVARTGFAVDATFNAQITPNIPFRRHAVHGGPVPRPRRHRQGPGAVLRNPDMARAYERIARHGARNGFYRGPIAERDRGRRAGPSALRDGRQDLASRADRGLRPQALRRRVARADRVGYRGYDVYSMGPPSSGGSTVGEGLTSSSGSRATRGCPTTSCTTSSRC